MKPHEPDSFHVRIAKAEHVFSAGHFITFVGHCERLHGHNYRVAVEVRGPLDENHLVVDFLLVHWADRWYFPAFNAADSAITVGAVLLVLDELLRVRKSD